MLQEGGPSWKGARGRGVGGTDSVGGGESEALWPSRGVGFSPGEWTLWMGFQPWSCESGCFGRIFFSSPDCRMGNKCVWE